jgi:hypothetical protein
VANEERTECVLLANPPLRQGDYIEGPLGKAVSLRQHFSIFPLFRQRESTFNPGVRTLFHHGFGIPGGIGERLIASGSFDNGSYYICGSDWCCAVVFWTLRKRFFGVCAIRDRCTGYDENRWDVVGNHDPTHQVKNL